MEVTPSTIQSTSRVGNSATTPHTHDFEGSCCHGLLMEGELTARNVPDEVRPVLELFSERTNVTPRLDEIAADPLTISTSDDFRTVLQLDKEGESVAAAKYRARPRGNSEETRVNWHHGKRVGVYLVHPGAGSLKKDGGKIFARRIISSLTLLCILKTSPLAISRTRIYCPQSCVRSGRDSCWTRRPSKAKSNTSTVRVASRRRWWIKGSGR